MIIATQSIVGAGPDVAVVVLDNGIDGVREQQLLRCEIRVLLGVGIVAEQAVMVGRNPETATAVLIDVVDVFVGLNRVA